MDKSHSNVKQEIDQAVKQAVKHVRAWSRREISSLLDQNRDSKPLIVPVGQQGYLIGNYAVREYQQDWYLIYRYSDQEYQFTSRESAFMYAICQQTRRGYLADQILKNDQDINRCKIEVDRFQFRLKQAMKKRNSHLIDLYRSRHQESCAQLNHHRFLLEKNLKLAKYFNL